MKEIFVYADWREVDSPHLMGVLRADLVRGKEVFSFTYDKIWISSANSLLLDPDLGLYSGPQYLREGKQNFGLFTDSSPDRWGRVLMNRREAILAKKENRKMSPLQESDYLLGVYDLYHEQEGMENAFIII